MFSDNTCREVSVNNKVMKESSTQIKLQVSVIYEIRRNFDNHPILINSIMKIRILKNVFSSIVLKILSNYLGVDICDFLSGMIMQPFIILI